MHAAPTRQTAHLRRGRLAIPQARCFVTCCAQRPTRALTEVACAGALLETIGRMERCGDLRLLCATIMPDHLHVLLELGQRLSLDRVLAKFKALTRPSLSAAGATWQANFHEHRLRADEVHEGYARYIFLNPYRMPHVPRLSIWPWWRTGKGVDFDFLTLLEEGGFPPEAWLAADLESLGLRAVEVGND
jgi:REP element-mobilizing transposase RayT